MDRSTIEELNRMNTLFYKKLAQPFSDSRNAPWNGWHNLINYLEQQNFKPEQLIDIGCGNGRFGVFFLKKFPQVSYLGIDSNQELLSLATNKLVSSQTRFNHLDIVDSLLNNNELNFKSEAKPTLFTLFGLIHHIPSHHLRKKLLSQLSKLSKPSDLLVISAWQFNQIPNLIKRQAEPSELHLKLEKNDYILDWQRSGHALRYCHLIEPTEIESLASSADLSITHTFSADGRTDSLNDYYILKKNG